MEAMVQSARSHETLELITGENEPGETRVSAASLLPLVLMFDQAGYKVNIL